MMECKGPKYEPLRQQRSRLRRGLHPDPQEGSEAWLEGHCWVSHPARRALVDASRRHDKPCHVTEGAAAASLQPPAAERVVPQIAMPRGPEDQETILRAFGVLPSEVPELCACRGLTAR